MTRRGLMCAACAAFAPAARSNPEVGLSVPVHRVTDLRAGRYPQELHRFWRNIWPEAVRNFGRGGIQLQTTDGPGEVRRSPGDQPIFVGLRRGAINLVLTDHLPAVWDKGRALAGASGIHDGYLVCVIALRYAHGDRVPFLSVNTCVHEILHALLGDLLVARPAWFQTGERESRVDWYATRLWLFHDGAALRRSARACLQRLQADAAR